MTNTPRDKLRWHQFSVRTLMLSVVVCALPLSWLAVQAERTRKQREATAVIDELGGKVCYDYQCDESDTQLGGTIAPGPAWLRKLGGDDFLASVVCAHVKGSQVTDDVLMQFADQLSDLELLDIERAQITDAGLAHLEKLSELKCLDLDHTQVTDDGLANLKGLTRLRRLNLCSTSITGAGLEHFRASRNIHCLCLNNTQVTDAALSHLKGLSNLEYLSLANTEVTDAGLVHLEGLANLKRLSLKGCEVSDEGVEKLQQALPNTEIAR